MENSTDEDTDKKKMKLTFLNRRNMVLDPLKLSNLLSDFPHFQGNKGLRKIIQHCRKLPSTIDLEELLLAADPSDDETKDYADDFGWDSNLSTILLLLHLIPPSAQGRKMAGKILEQTSKSIWMPSLPALNPTSWQLELRRNLDKNAIQCKSTSSPGFRKHLNAKHLEHNDQQAHADVTLQCDVALKPISSVASTNVEEFLEIHVQAKDAGLQSLSSQDKSE
ncbi:hypothetical protein Q8A73_002976 [Channa argus]|nr:hypothetical protein Q8A73_002976 [Channa argus]